MTSVEEDEDARAKADMILNQDVKEKDEKSMRIPGGETGSGETSPMDKKDEKKEEDVKDKVLSAAQRRRKRKLGKSEDSTAFKSVLGIKKQKMTFWDHMNPMSFLAKAYAIWFYTISMTPHTNAKCDMWPETLVLFPGLEDMLKLVPQESEVTFMLNQESYFCQGFYPFFIWFLAIISAIGFNTKIAHVLRFHFIQALQMEIVLIAYMPLMKGLPYNLGIGLWESAAGEFFPMVWDFFWRLVQPALYWISVFGTILGMYVDIPFLSASTYMILDQFMISEGSSRDAE